MLNTIIIIAVILGSISGVALYFYKKYKRNNRLELIQHFNSLDSEYEICKKDSIFMKDRETKIMMMVTNGIINFFSLFNAMNFVTLSVTHPEKGRFNVTVSKIEDGCKSVSQIHNELQEENRELKKELDLAWAENKRLRERLLIGE